MSNAIQNYIDTHSKSQATGLFVTVLFGPLGLLYSSWVAAIILSLITFFTLGTIFIPIFCWFVSLLISWDAISGHNKKVKAAAELGIK